MNQLATLSAPEPRLLVIQPFDRSAMAEIEKAILKSDLGLTPNNDGKIIRIPIPQLDRRAAQGSGQACQEDRRRVSRLGAQSPAGRH